MMRFGSAWGKNGSDHPALRGDRRSSGWGRHHAGRRATTAGHSGSELSRRTSV